MDDSTIERLVALPALATVPRADLEWLAAHGQVRRFADGGVAYSQDQPEGLNFSPESPNPGLFIVLSGRLVVRRMDRAGAARDIRELLPGSVSGMLPFSRLKPRNAAGFIVSDGPSEILLVADTDIQEMTRACYEFTARCVHEMLDRARVFTADDRQQEKMASLGRLSAGIAHELDNPSSAIERSARAMDACRRDVAAAARALGAAGLDAERLAAVAALEAAAERPLDEALSPIAYADREDAIGAWLADQKLQTGLADRLAATGVTLADLDAARGVLTGRELAVALAYVAAVVTAGRLAAEIEQGARRIHSLVSAVKKHTHMDRAPAAEAVRLDTHLNDTLTLVAARARRKGIALSLTVAPDLPAVEGRAGELNQVWLNLVDNAIDAAPQNGHVSVAAACERGSVTVRVVDDGPGIAAEHLGHIFDPFFTTKPVGQGAGLGLDTVRTIVQSHRGVVDVDTRPGRTEFRVSLPPGTTA